MPRTFRLCVAAAMTGVEARVRLARILLLSSLFALGCHNNYVPPEMPMPPNTVMLSQMMRELSSQPGFTEALLAQLDSQGGKKGPALMTPKLVDELRKRILGKQWERLDRFPGWTMREVNPTVDVADKFAAKNPKLVGMSAVHPGAAAPGLDEKQARVFLDLGPYALERAETVSLDEPSKLPPYSNAENQTTLGADVVRGDGPNALAAEHAESQRLADVLNRLAVNGLEGAKPFSVWRSWKALTTERSARGGPPVLDKPNMKASTPDLVIEDLQATGHTVTVQDARYFANFGHFHYKGQDVMMPFWIDTQIAVPHSGGLLRKRRPLLLPVSHAEYEWHIRGPLLNADVSWYFGIDGKAEWRTMDTLDQAWVMKRNAHTYTGADAVEVTRLTGLMTVAYMREHARRPELPFGGYYALGVCQDNVSAIEKKMTGKSTLFPNTADTALFDDPRDAEVNALMEAIPKDRAGHKPEPERVFGSLPVEASVRGFESLTVPGLADDLKVTYAAWQSGELERTHNPWPYVWAMLAVLGAASVVRGLWLRRRRYVRRA